MPDADESLIDKCRRIFHSSWKRISEASTTPPVSDVEIHPTLQAAIAHSINSPTKTYRYVLPTQILAKVADDRLDCHCIQASSSRKGPFDARSICDEIIVSFDKSNDGVLGGSPEPYVNNPLRRAEVSKVHRQKQKDKQGWDDLCLVLDQVETANDPTFTATIFDLVLWEIFRRLSTVRVTYSVPKRISLEDSLKLIDEYVSSKSGGDRVLAVSAALLESAGKRFQLFQVRRAKINASDASERMLADIECVDSYGEVVLAVEVKDRSVSVTQILHKLPGLRAAKVSEILFIAQKGVESGSQEEVRELVMKEFSSGQNVYSFDLTQFARSLLALLGEGGRRDFLESVGRHLDEYSSAVQHRRSWAELLKQY